MDMKGYYQKKWSLYYKLKRYHEFIESRNDQNEAKQKYKLYQDIEADIKQEINDLELLSEEELLKILEETVARPKKSEEVVETKDEKVTKEELPAMSEVVNEAHDLLFDRATGKWLHIKIKYKASEADVEVIGPNQAVAMKRIHDLFTNKAIKGRK